jgi:transmembrane sensor
MATGLLKRSAPHSPKKIRENTVDIQTGCLLYRYNNQFMSTDKFETIEDFVFNRSFRNWVLDNPEADASFWEKWMAENQDKINLLHYSKSIVYAISVSRDTLSEAEINHEIGEILKKVAAHEGNKPEEHTIPDAPPSRKRIRYLAVVAAVAGLLVISFFLRNTRKAAEQSKQVSETSHISNEVSLDTEKLNDSDTAYQLSLPDGSNVRLGSKSKLNYSSKSFAGKREVFLSGEAFFDVTKNPALPFVVHTKNMVTKVLGTSFRVRDYSTDKKAIVTVSTGKVSVYKSGNYIEKNKPGDNSQGVIVTPNQQVVLDIPNKQLSKMIIDKPVILETKKQSELVFSSTPLSEVFKVLQDAYGIPILSDESVINTCSLSARMGNEGFFEKLDLICRAVDASYESIDGNIFISSNGCK